MTSFETVASAARTQAEVEVGGRREASLRYALCCCACFVALRNKPSKQGFTPCQRTCSPESGLACVCSVLYKRTPDESL